MVEFDIVTVDIDAKSTYDQLERKLHSAIKVLIKLNNATRWVQINLDSLSEANGCYKFNGILSHTMYLGDRTFHQESEVKGRYAFSHGFGTLTIL